MVSIGKYLGLNVRIFGKSLGKMETSHTGVRV